MGGTIVVTDESKVPDPEDADALLEFLRTIDVEPCRAEVPKSCHGGCPNGGVCQLSTGTCVCYQGFDVVDGDCPVDGEASSLFNQADLGVEETSWMSPMSCVAVVFSLFVLI